MSKGPWKNKVRCKTCLKMIAATYLAKHQAGKQCQPPGAAPRKPSFKTCPHCSTRMRSDNLTRHIRRKHGRAPRPVVKEAPHVQELRAAEPPAPRTMFVFDQENVFKVYLRAKIRMGGKECLILEIR